MDQVNLQKSNNKEDNFWCYLPWICMLIMHFTSLGWLAFAAPIIINICIPEKNRTPLYEKNYKMSLNYGIMFWVIVAAVILITGTVVLLSFLFSSWEAGSIFLIFVAVMFGLLLLAVCIFYVVVAVIAIVKASNGEEFNVPGLIPFVR